MTQQAKASTGEDVGIFVGTAKSCNCGHAVAVAAKEAKENKEDNEAKEAKDLVARARMSLQANRTGLAGAAVHATTAAAESACTCNLADTSALNFNNATIEGPVFFKKAVLAGGTSFEACTFKGPEVNFTDAALTGDKTSFENCSFSGSSQCISFVGTQFCSMTTTSFANVIIGDNCQFFMMCNKDQIAEIAAKRLQEQRMQEQRMQEQTTPEQQKLLDHMEKTNTFMKVSLNIATTWNASSGAARMFGVPLPPVTSNMEKTSLRIIGN